MNCQYCQVEITASSRGPKPWISIRPDGTYGSYMCMKDGVLFPAGHAPQQTI